MSKTGVQRMEGVYLHESISSYKSKVGRTERQLKGEEEYLAEMQAEEELRIWRFSNDLKAGAMLFMADVIDGKIKVPELDHVYLKEETRRKFGQSSMRPVYHYNKAFNFSYDRREVGRKGKERIYERYPTNIGVRRNFYIPIKIENLANAEQRNIGASGIIVEFDMRQSGLDYDDLVLIFWYYNTREGLSTIEAIKKIGKYSSGVTHDNLLRELYLNKTYHDRDEKKGVV